MKSNELRRVKGLLTGNLQYLLVEKHSKYKKTPNKHKNQTASTLAVTQTVYSRLCVETMMSGWQFFFFFPTLSWWIFASRALVITDQTQKGEGDSATRSWKWKDCIKEFFKIKIKDFTQLWGTPKGSKRNDTGFWTSNMWEQRGRKGKKKIFGYFENSILYLK